MLTKEQLEIRKSGIGGSDVAAVLGLSRWKTPVELWLEKTGRATPAPLSSPAVHWGNKLEEAVATEYASRHGVELAEPRETYSLPGMSYMIANPDRLIVGKNAVLECKTASNFKASEWGDEGTDQIPTEYLLQVAHYGIVLDADYVDIAVLIGGSDYREYRYSRNEALENVIKSRCAYFWEANVLRNVSPKPQNRCDIENLYPENSERFLKAEDEDIKYLKEFREYKKQISDLEEKLEEVQNKIVVKISENQGLVDTNGIKICTFKTQVSKRFDTERLKTEHPDLYSEFSKENVSRVFRVFLKE